jgi:probable aminopeptidase NPEPL1
MTEIKFSAKVAAALTGAEVVVVVAPKSALDEGWHRVALGKPWAAALDPVVEDLSPGDLGAAAGTYGPKGAPRRIFAAALPDAVGRHNSPTRAEMIRAALSQVSAGKAKKVAVVIRLTDPDHYLAAAVAVARCHPLFSRSSGKKSGKVKVTVAAALDDGTPVKPSREINPTVEAVRFAARLVDTPAEDMKTADVEAEARAAVKGLKGVKVRSIVGDRLLKSRLGGIHAVGRTAVVPPRLTILEYTPPKKPRRTVALVGKGVIYDTGGLNIKVQNFMCNMKADMGGAAAVLGAFLALVKTGCSDKVYCLLCLAENAVGPNSYRPDDILTFHSGKTVEINNTDAEGRLVLADGVSYAARNLKADLVIDAATLTGAALITTGQIVSCTVSNRDGVEAASVAAGRLTGDLTFPILFIPEFTKQEFKSKVADMRNSVANRMNAQSSCAAQFVYNHIEDVNPAWLHLDIAGPAFRDGRATGYGVALMAEIVRSVTPADLA